MMSVVPYGAEMSLEISGAPQQWDGEPPAVSKLRDDGTSVSLWTRDNQAYAQQFDALGYPIGSRIHVSADFGFTSTAESLAVTPDGGFVATWTTKFPRLNSEGLVEVLYVGQFDDLGRRFRAFQVEEFYSGRSHLAVGLAGAFGIAWQRGSEIAVRTFAPSGSRLSDAVVINDGSAGSRLGDLGMDSEGSFVTVWSGSTPSTRAVLARRFNLVAQPLGDAFLVHESSTGYPDDANVGMAADGSFLVAWEEDHEVYARQFASSGEPMGARFQVNTLSLGSQGSPSVDTGADGESVIVWHSYQHQSVAPYIHSGHLYSRSYDPLGNALGDEYRVGRDSTDWQMTPDLDVGSDGTLLVTWAENEHGIFESNLSGIYSQRYRSSSTEVTHTEDDGLYGSLREAILHANRTPGHDRIDLPAGVYSLTRAGRDDDGLLGDLDITDDLTIVGSGAGETIIDANAIDRLFHIPTRIGSDGNPNLITVQISGVTLQNGRVTDIGGAIYNRGHLTLRNSRIVGNQAIYGGGISSFSSGYGTISLRVENSTISTNTADYGGGISIVGDSHATIINSTISGNSAETDGGGLAMSGGNFVTIDFSTIAENVADADGDGWGNGGGLSVTMAARLSIGSSLIANNTSSGTASDLAGRVESRGYNLVEATVGSEITGVLTGNVIGRDPLLLPLANNGGSTETHALRSRSPALNAGDTATLLATDQRGAARVQGKAPDIGALESEIPGSGQMMVAAADAGGGPHVRVFDSDGEERLSFFAFDPAFTGGVRVTTGDVTGDGMPDVIAAAGPGGGPHVRVFDGRTGEQIEGPVGSFFAYDPSFAGGVFLAAADFDLDGRADIVTGAGSGGRPHVRIFSGADGRELVGFFDPSRRDAGIYVATGDINGDGTPDVITGSGPGLPATVRVYAGLTGETLAGRWERMNPYPGFQGGVFVAAGDVDGDGRDDVITGAGAGGGPHVKAFSGVDASELASFFAYDPSFTGGVRVGVGDVNQDGGLDIITGAGPGGGPHVKGFDLLGTSETAGFFAFHPAFAGGVFVSGSLISTLTARSAGTFQSLSPRLSPESVALTVANSLVTPATTIAAISQDKALLAPATASSYREDSMTGALEAVWADWSDDESPAGSAAAGESWEQLVEFVLGLEAAPA